MFLHAQTEKIGLRFKMEKLSFKKGWNFFRATQSIFYLDIFLHFYYSYCALREKTNHTFIKKKQ